MAAIELSDVRKTYPGGFEAVKGISLPIRDGEFVVLVGPSGCGKSTLLRMIAGLERITSGTVKIANRVVNNLEPMQRDIAMVFQNYALYPHMTVFQNLAYGLKNRGMAKSEIDIRVDEVARILEIEPYLARKPRALSGGQRQRVAMGRAIVREPAAFLFDEPLSNLDAKLRIQMRGEIKQLQKRLGTTSVYVTHDQLEAMTLADRLVVLNTGEIEQIGTPLDIYRRPATTFVAAFIGSPAMNLVKAHRRSGAAVFGDASLPMADDIASGMEVTVGVRPEDLTVAGTKDALRLTLKIAYVEELGATRLVHGTVDGQNLVASVPVDCPLGETLEVHAEPSALHFFDPQTGRRLN
ncbi:MAG: sn-glycerol-3-phosphate import ATP-binding protein UgpC [Alphaproteobacteria bacterium]|nr:sn-glycerol-3-phosphate import ATP-binding protein UgpC [Alphaproteobacteria bacterium]